eukprot:2692895-Rhodomonas_salina.1
MRLFTSHHVLRCACSHVTCVSGPCADVLPSHHGLCGRCGWWESGSRPRSAGPSPPCSLASRPPRDRHAPRVTAHAPRVTSYVIVREHVMVCPT